MTRPQPRTSKLTGYTRVQPNPTTPYEPDYEDPEKQPTNPKVKATFRIDADLMDQVRSAYWATAYQTGITSLGEWVQEALQVKLTQEQERYNGGSRFEPLGPGSIPTGRRA